MSRGPGRIERAIAKLFARSRNQALTIEAITDAAYSLAGRSSTRAQRLAATRAAHRLVERVLETDRRLGRMHYAIRRSPEMAPLRAFVRRIGIWRRRGSYERRSWQTTMLKGRLHFYPANLPLQVWAGETEKHRPSIWTEVVIEEVSARFVVVRHRDETVRLNRSELWHSYVTVYGQVDDRGLFYTSRRSHDD